MAISFFAHPPHIARGRRSHNKKTLFNASSLIRANQISEYLEAKYNPENGYKDDLCIYVKRRVSGELPPKAYIDIVDDTKLISFLEKRPHIPVIASSEASCEYLKKRLRQDIVFIPQQHCNFERIQREKRPIRTIGIPEGLEQFQSQFSTEDLKKRLELMGFLLLDLITCLSREDVVEYYKKIDLQLLFFRSPHPLKQPLKIFNAASFGIPTIGYPHSGYKEAEKYYVPAEDTTSCINEIQKFVDSEEYYDSFSKKIREHAEKYHIHTIATYYKKLETK